MAEQQPPNIPAPEPDDPPHDSLPEDAAEIHGTEWLLAQLSGDRAASAPSADTADGADTADDGASDAVEDGAAETEPGRSIADLKSDAPEGSAAGPKLRWSWTNEAIEEIPTTERTSEPATEDALAGDEPAEATDQLVAHSAPDARSAPTPLQGEPELPLFIDHSRADSLRGEPKVPAPPMATSADSEPADAEQNPETARFFWGLTPGDGFDPLIHPTTEATPDSALSGEPASEPGVRAEPEPAAKAEAAAEAEPAAEVVAEPEAEFNSARHDTPEFQPEAQSEPELEHEPEAQSEPPISPEPESTPAVVAAAGSASQAQPAEKVEPQSRSERRRRDAAESARTRPTDGITPLSPAPAVAVGRSGRRTAAAAAPAASGAAMAASGGASGGGSGGSRRASGGRATRILFWLAGALLLVLILVGLYVLGTQLPGMMQGASEPTPAASATRTPTPTPTPTATAVATGPQAPGTHAWDTLRGGECLEPFTTPWAQTFTVVDCASPHAAQLVYVGVFPGDAAAPFPGAAQLSSQINLLCTRPGIINPDVAGQVSDAQIQGTYPATEEQWKDGQRSYFCFVNRVGGEPLAGSIAGPGPAS